MDVIPVIGYASLGVLIVTWLTVSFSQPSPRRAMIEWVGASALYVALLSLFVHLLSRSLEQESTVGIVAFGFLVTFFSVGLLLCLFQTATSMRGARSSVSSATN
jgi:protein-S-isoprenylcysteine O-methyltransferase Ste14